MDILGLTPPQLLTIAVLAVSLGFLLGKILDRAGR